MPQNKNICSQPAEGTLENAPRPDGTSEKLIPREGDKYPGHLKYSGAMYPKHAIMLTRPCFTSISLRRLNISASPSLVKPAGSQ